MADGELEFINDIYHDQKILKDKIIPEEIIRTATFYRPQCEGINPPLGVWCHITGTDSCDTATDRSTFWKTTSECLQACRMFSRIAI